MKIATWNVNSIKARAARLEAWLTKHAPDVLCLQELKCDGNGYPHRAIEALGYVSSILGQRTYNGVAILSRKPPDEVRCGMEDDVDDPQARLIAARFSDLWIASAYFPNGGDVGSPKFEYKLAWMRRLREYLARRFRPEDNLVLAGDFNVAPDDSDVARPEEWATSVLCHPEARAALEAIRAFGFVDVFRKHHPDGGIYSWWDYRMLGFPKNNGLRIDHLFATEPVARRSVRALVDRDERKGKSPSDHAPVVAEFDFSAP